MRKKMLRLYGLAFATMAVVVPALADCQTISGYCGDGTYTGATTCCASGTPYGSCQCTTWDSTNGYSNCGWYDGCY